MDTHSVLVVDDDYAMSAMLAAMFRDAGYRVEVEPCARGAVARVTERDFDVVLSDVRMPGGSGLDLVAEVKRLRPDLPVILMTGIATTESGAAAFRAGAFDYLAKPFDLDLVAFIVRRAIEERARRRGANQASPPGAPSSAASASSRRS